MKTYTVLLALLFNAVIVTASNDTTYSTSMMIIKSDTLFYNWEVKHYIEFGDTNMTMHNPVYNGQIWFSGFTTWGQFAISKDNLETWQMIKGLGNLKKPLKDFSLLPNNKIFVTADTLVNGKMKDGIIYEYDYQDLSWIEYKHEIFKDKVIANIEFKDNMNGVLVVSDNISLRNLYRTENGGKEWYRLDNISNLLETDFYFINRVEYFKESGILMCVVHNINTKLNYFIFSKDFGDNWTELRIEPKKNDGVSDYFLHCGFYNKNDSLWFAGAAGTGHGPEECTEFIYFSPDLGKTWAPQYLAISDYPFDYFNSIAFFDNSKIGLACESSPRILMTFDGGEHWTWINNAITKNAQRTTQDTGDGYYVKYKLVKANNQMIFFGKNKIFKFNVQSFPTSVDENNSELALSAFYNHRVEAIEIKSNSDEIVNSISLYDITGKLLYTENNQLSRELYISKDKLQNTKVVFALIQLNGQTLIKQIIIG